MGVACLLCAVTHAGTETRAEPADVAMRYVQACQDGAWDAVIKTTAWMCDRLNRAAADNTREAAADELCEALRQRTAEGNRLRAEGIEDVYVFAPGAKVRVVRTDSGRDDLERSTRGRVWLELVYPVRDMAPRNQEGRAIRSLMAGLNVSDDGLILKASVVGNAEVDVDSIVDRWDAR